MLIGIDIGGTNLKSALIDKSGNIITSNSIKTNSKDTNQFLQSIIDIINEFKSQNDISCIGIGVPGVVNNEGLIVVSPNLPNLNGINLRNEISKLISLPLFVDNDANTAAIAELIAGNGQEFNDFIYVTLGTGIGGAIIINRQILRGSIGGAGEIGHTIISCETNNSNILPYRQGILEELAGKNQIIQRMKDLMINSGRNYINEIDVKEISRLADKGDEIAITCLQETGYYIGVGIASAMNLLDISNVVIGGGISESGDYLFNSIENTLKQKTLPSISNRVKIKKAFFRKETGLIGAALFGLQMLNKELNV
jgi:glucokinase